MLKPFLLLLVALLIVLGCGSDLDDLVKTEPQTTDSAVLEIPFDSIALDDLSSFATDGANWVIAGEVTSNYLVKHDLKIIPGHGVLVNLPVENGAAHIATTLEHMDIEISFDVMVPKESNSGIYFQGRYEVQILDSWGVENPGPGDMGGLYQRWEEDRQGFEGKAPDLNAAIAPGLWQHFHILFRAPRFDREGKKIQNALFKHVYLNDRLIHENVEVKGPTRSHQLQGEAPWGPLFIQGDHGPVAFKNFLYKLSDDDTISLSEIQYDFYDFPYDHLPFFDTVNPTSSGSLEYIDIEKVTSKKEEYGIDFKGKMMVPSSGNYLFETDLDDGGDFWIDSTLVVSNSAKMGRDQSSSIINLKNGTHDFRLSFVQDRSRALAQISYEGPQISKRNFGRPPASALNSRSNSTKLILPPPDAPEMIRGFIMHKGKKLTHIISVGDPTGVHFAYNLPEAALVKVWKGDFGDASEMWEGRGKEQILQPTLASVDLSNALPFALLQSTNDRWPEDKSALKYMGYDLNSDRRPVFRYLLHEREILDEISPAEAESIQRNITISGEGPSICLKLGEGLSIQKVADDLYSVDGHYFIISTADLTIRQEIGRQQLVAQIESHNFSYKILW